MLYPCQNSFNKVCSCILFSLFQETTYLYIPNNAVGAIIGTKGSHIRNIIRFSNASVKIAPLEQDKQVENQNNAQQERKVTIVGSPEAQWKVSPNLHCRSILACLKIEKIMKKKLSSHRFRNYLLVSKISSSRKTHPLIQSVRHLLRLHIGFHSMPT